MGGSVTEFTGTELAMVVFGGATNINVTGYNITVDGVTSYIAHDYFQPHVLVSGLELSEHTIEIEPVFPEGVEPYMMISGFFTRDENKATVKN